MTQASSHPIKHVVVVGGGSAGWMTACVIAAEHAAQPERGVTVTLIESPDIPTIGVGEGTWPSMRMTLQRIGLPEDDLLRVCDASFKQGTLFTGWSGVGDDAYYHPFSLPAEYSHLNLARYWLEQGQGRSFAEFVTPQAQAIDHGLAPKQASMPEYAFALNYAYHFDAGKFAGLLHDHAVDRLGVTYVRANVQEVASKPNGDIAAVKLDTGRTLHGDLFVDCTGQQALLLGQHLGVELVSVQDILFNDTAVAAQVPYDRADDAIASVTRATAMDAGWIWDIGLQSRRGIGYVYSGSHLDDEDALKSISAYVRSQEQFSQVDVEQIAFRKIKFKPGYRTRFWSNNCVAVGLSAGFVEPLEASALALIEQSAAFIAQNMPADSTLMPVVAKRFNAKMAYHWSRIVEFLKLHYAVSQRADTSYWRDCRCPASMPESLVEKLEFWQQQPPWHDDAPRVDELFPSASYQYVLYGMGFRPRYERSFAASHARMRAQADAALQANREKTRQLLRGLPNNRDLINAVVADNAAAEDVR